MRQIVMDTETTGIDPREGHRIIEIGGIELINRRFTGRTYHQYVNPERDIEAEAIEIHGITNDRVANEPVFAQIADELWEFMRGAQLIIHNAPFDVGFFDHEFRLLKALRGEPVLGPVAEHCSVLDTLKMAREMHPGQRNSLDALCKRYDIDNGQRVLHGALLDSEILADVYLAMTGGQTALSLAGNDEGGDREAGGASGLRRIDREGLRLAVTRPSEAEWQAHHQRLEQIRKAAGECRWDTLAAPENQH
ncbi:DNA polymerase III subunit epsilon [Salinicola corii]|uniref:DNA polymerase III subunit epsilon n=1 Tax=Salinicola corii TaxID=2606937 RepID=A0A640WG61_9GAMM|nr:DNA polymerase III subunit epsilon [Salinicola corii]KAA0019212.1 DNA polymerase III subunit epsilon [Salinicola corii]